jgi:S-(hydroxymethyl)glutathione dehydrogenase/alcohol dehydrogenase
MTSGGVDCRAAIQWDSNGGPWSIETIRVDEPRRGEVLVRLEASGLCHTDHHLAEGGYPDIARPLVGGHEGAGVVEATGAGVTGLAAGDRVVLCVPVPACGGCVACLRGMSHLCERGALTGGGRQISDGTSRHHARGTDLGIFVFAGTFAEYTVVAQETCHRVEGELTGLDVCSVSCAGVTGWGAVQNTAELRPGDVAVVVGVGGVGANALMAARYLGASAVLAVDPLARKRDLAKTFGADDAVSDLDQARMLVSEWTRGRMADVVIMAMGVGDGAQLAAGLALLGKRGRLAVVNVHPPEESTATVSLRDLQSMEKQVRGCLSGSWHGRQGVRFLLDLAARGRYDPARIVDATWTLDQIEEGYAHQLDGHSLRGVLTF